MLIDDYFEYQIKFEEKYGIKTIVLMEVGSFYEIYGVNNNTEKIGDVQIVTDLLNIQMTRRNKNILENNRSNSLMAGFPSISLKRFLKILIDANYTVILVEQITPPPNPKRDVTKIYSPGTYIEELTEKNNITTNIISIYLEESACHKTNINLFLLGMSCIDLTTGKTIVYQNNRIKFDKNSMLEEIYRFIENFSAKEVLFYSNYLTSINKEDINQSISSNNRLININYNSTDPEFLKINYINTLLKKVYPEYGVLSPIEFLDLEDKYYASVAFIILINYAYEHNESIIYKLEKPVPWEYQEHLILYHNAIYQLNLISNNGNKSLFDIINKTSTPMGKRLLKYRLHNPIVSIEELNRRYEMIDILLNHKDIINNISIRLREINDIERLVRRVNLKLLYPMEILNLYISVENIVNIFQEIKIIYSSNIIDINESVINKLQLFLEECNRVFNISIIGKYNFNNIDTTFFNEGICEEIDSIYNEIKNIDQYFKDESQYLSNLIEKDSAFVKYESNDRDGYFLYLTSKRAEILKDQLKEEKKENKYEIKKYIGNNVKIVNNEIKNKSDELIILNHKIQSLVKSYYIQSLGTIEEKYSNIINEASYIISIIDVTVSSAKCAIQYNYNKPIIINDIDNASLLNIKGLRHPIIERLDDIGMYVGNDVYLNAQDNNLGILLYGVNGVGKSSLGKAIGCNIVMAQMGMYVACEEMIFFPYTKIFTRINGDDNIFKGMSSFVLEMNELKSIIKFADNNSIVLGDEICKGTEEISALSIIASCIENFKNNNVNFVMATHFHKLSTLNSINKLEGIHFKHLSVEYDEDNDIMIYGRKIKDGAGSTLYGLEIAKYILKDDEFINRAFKVRKELLEIDEKILTDKKSNYSKMIYMDMCHICKSKDNLDTHHIIEQNNFEDSEFKYHNDGNLINKNNIDNLVVLCKEHHDMVHHNNLIINGWIHTTNGRKLDYQYVCIESPTKINKDKRDKVITILESNNFNKDNIDYKLAMHILKNNDLNITLKTLKKYLSINA